MAEDASGYAEIGGDGTVTDVGARTRRWEAAMLAAFALPLGVTLACLAWRSSLMLPLNTNEGWNAYLASAAAQGGPLYFPAGDFRTDNYPPLSFIIVGALTHLVPDAIMAGRIVAWAAFAVIATEIAAALRLVGDDWVAAATGALAWLGFAVVHAPDYVGMDDPQMLAHAVMGAGLLLLLRGHWAAAAATMAAALFVKHNIIALPLAALLWLAIGDRRAAARFAIAGLVTGVAGLLACRLVFGADFVSGLLAPRHMSIAGAYRAMLAALPPMEIPLAIAVASLAGALRDRIAVLFALWAVLALVVGAVASMGDGVDVNALFECWIALALAAGHALARIGAAGLARWRQAAIALLGLPLLISAARNLSADALTVTPWLKQIRAEADITQTQVALMASLPGAAFCEQPTLCYWAGKPYEIDVFNFSEAVIAHQADAAPLARRIADSGFASIALRRPLAEPRHLVPEPIMAAIAQRYRLAIGTPDGAQVLVPR